MAASASERLVVVIKAARNLVLADKQNATSNPFCRVGFCEGEDEIASKGKVRGWISTTLNSQPKLQQVHETQVVPRSLHPIYGGPNNTFALDPPLHPATGQMLQLRVEVWSKEKLGRDLFMGQVVLPPNQYATAASERWLPLCGRPGKNDFVTGEILISITPPASVLSSRRPSSVPAIPPRGASAAAGSHYSMPAAGRAPPSSAAAAPAPGYAPYAPPSTTTAAGAPPPSDLEANYDQQQQPPAESARAKVERKVREFKQLYAEVPMIRKAALVLALAAAGAFLLGLLLIIVPFIGWAWTLLLWVLAVVLAIAGGFCWVAPEAYKSMFSAEKRTQLEMALMTNES